ncbi:FadR/GntR family transcriptional regulator [Streptomyces sp. CA-111067]|uniref:FadR/GntR family transcriptional regulator n=1 Tax=Streptomyces sp. CA-111067 TaxID=3240046 RepID=UPI003D977FEE
MTQSGRAEPGRDRRPAVPQGGAAGPAAPSTAIGRPPRLGVVLMAELVGRIADGRIPGGSLLPTEAELQEEFSVSRTALREGLKAVEERGMIEIRQGRGAVVRPTAEWNLLDQHVLTAMLDRHPTPEIFEQLMDVRMMLEPELARLAAHSMDEQELAAMRELLERSAGRLDDPDRFLEEDVRFHQLIVDASGNWIARAIMAKIEQPLRSGRRLTNTIPHALEQAQGAHLLIYQRLLAADAEGAGRAMTDHLSWSREQLLSRWTRDDEPRTATGTPQEGDRT